MYSDPVMILFIDTRIYLDGGAYLVMPAERRENHSDVSPGYRHTGDVRLNVAQ